MIVDAAYEAYEDAGIEKPQEQIDAVFTGSIYSNKGPHECADALKLFNKPVSLLDELLRDGDGPDPARRHVDRRRPLRHGSRGRIRQAQGSRRPPGPSVVVDRVRDLPQTPAGWFSLAAATYFDKYGAGREDLAKIAIKNHANGCLAPEVLPQAPDHRGGLLQGDGSSRGPSGSTTRPPRPTARPPAILTRTRPREPTTRSEPVRVKGVTVRAGPNPQKDPGQRLPVLEADRLGPRRRLRDGRDHQPARGDQPGAGPRLLLAHRAPHLRRPRLLREGRPRRSTSPTAPSSCGGDLPVNTDGGLKTFGHPTGATGVRMVYENVTAAARHRRASARSRRASRASSRSPTTSAVTRPPAASPCSGATRRPAGARRALFEGAPAFEPSAVGPTGPARGAPTMDDLRVRPPDRSGRRGTR